MKCTVVFFFLDAVVNFAINDVTSVTPKVQNCRDDFFFDSFGYQQDILS